MLITDNTFPKLHFSAYGADWVCTLWKCGEDQGDLKPFQSLSSISQQDKISIRGFRSRNYRSGVHQRNKLSNWKTITDFENTGRKARSISVIRNHGITLVHIKQILGDRSS